MKTHHLLSLGLIATLTWLSGTTANATSLADGLYGMNWASDSTDWPDGLNASQTYAQQYAVGQTAGNKILAAGGKTVRMPVDSTMTTGNNWYLYAGAINGVGSTGCKVILCYWIPSGSTVDTNAWYKVWDVVNTSFGTNHSTVFFEPINEPTYSTDTALANVYAQFLARYHPANWKCILAGNNVETICTTLGADSRLNNQYLGFHMYSWFHATSNWQGYYSYCATCVGSYASRTVITETGVQTDGRNPAVPFWQQWDFSMQPDQDAFSGVLAWARDNNVGSIAYSGVNYANLYHWFNSSWTEMNKQVSDMFRWSWHETVTSPSIAAGTYRLQNRSDSEYLDNLGATTNGATVCQYASSSSNNQKWTFIQEDSVWYRLQNVAVTSEYLDGYGYTANGSAVKQYGSDSSWNQRWALEVTDSGYYKLINKQTGICVDTGGLTGNGVVVQQWGSGTSYNQQWLIK